jgi:hypothetical protein
VRARRRRSAGSSITSRDPFEQWSQAVQIRREWLGHALSTEPADRPATEQAITTLYSLVHRPPPEFVWADSPAAALPLVEASPSMRLDSPLSMEAELANQWSDLRSRLRRRAHVPQWSLMLDALALLRRGGPIRDVLTAGVRDVLNRTVRESIAGPVMAAMGERRALLWFGQHDVDWLANCDVLQRVDGVLWSAEDAEQLALWSTLARSCGWWWPREGRCVIAERPLAIRTEPVPGSQHDELRLHSDDSPAVVYADGWAVHMVHGFRVPAWVIEEPTAERIAAERNIEVRRCAIERLGWPAFIEQARLTLVSQADDPGNPEAVLQLYDLPYDTWGAPTRLLVATNGSVERDGTRRQYGLRVPPWFTDPVDAAAWTYGLTGPQYAQLQRRT